MRIILSMLTSDGKERPFALNGPRSIIGRDSRCDVRIPLPNIELRHCEITVDGARIRLRDLGSICGTLHNGNRIDADADLNHGDQITIGPVTFVVRVEVLRHDADTIVEITTLRAESPMPDGHSRPPLAR